MSRVRRLLVILGLGAQFATVVANFPILPVLVVQAAGVGAGVGASFVSMTFVAQGLGTLMMGLRARWVGPGQPLPLSPTPIYIASSVKAAGMGGIPLVVGMTLFSGIVQAALTPLLRAMQHILSTNIGYLVLVMIGFDLGYFGVNQLVEVATGDRPELVWVTVGCFLLIYAIRVGVWAPVGRMAVFFTMVVGYLVMAVGGWISEDSVEAIRSAPWFRMPTWEGGWSFSWPLAVPFVIAALISAVKVVGSFTALQRMEDPENVEPDMENVARGNMVDSLGSVVSGLLGGAGVGISSSSTAIAVSSQVTDRRVAWVTGVILLAIALVNKLAVVMMFTPMHVVAAIMIYLGVSLIQSGLPVIAHSTERRRCALYMSVAMVLALSQPLYPDLFGALPEGLRLFTGSGTAIACVVAVGLRLVAHVRRGDEKLTR